MHIDLFNGFGLGQELGVKAVQKCFVAWQDPENSGRFEASCCWRLALLAVKRAFFTHRVLRTVLSNGSLAR
jgi:hypothetical protein